uniref:Uncharacterized protein n=1 Tax=Parascaris equorum TaxID=6256 RepID=A0A914RV03_PAREQ
MFRDPLKILLRHITLKRGLQMCFRMAQQLSKGHLKATNKQAVSERSYGT